jgi:hypothetical protein
MAVAGSGGRIQAGQLLGVSRWTVWRAHCKRVCAVSGEVSWTPGVRKAHARKLSDHSKLLVEQYVTRPSLSTVSPFKRHVYHKRKDGQVETPKWHFLDVPITTVWQGFCVEFAAYLGNGVRANGTTGIVHLGLRGFFAVVAALKYVKRRKLAAQRLICCCPYHVGFRFALAGLNRYVSGAHASSCVPVPAVRRLQPRGGRFPLPPSPADSGA